MTDFVKCPICNDEVPNKPLLADLAMCGTCMHLFKLIDFPAEGYHEYRSSAHSGRTPEHITMANRAVNIRFKIFNHFAKKDSSVLEIGCGHRYFLDKLRDNGYKAEGTELSKAIIEDLEDHKIHYGNPSEIEDLPVYDNICGFHVLEHINNPVKELKTLVEHMSDDGVMVLEFPCMNFYTRTLNGNKFYEVPHTQYFSQLSMMMLFKKCGLMIVHQTTFWDNEKMAVTLICLAKEKADKKELMEKTFSFMGMND